MFRKGLISSAHELLLSSWEPRGLDQSCVKDSEGVILSLGSLELDLAVCSGSLCFVFKE